MTNKGDKRSGGQKGRAISAALLGIVAVAVILVFGTFWMGQSAKKDTDRAVRSVSLLYLNELVGRREQVVEKNLQDKINVIHIAIDLMSEEDLSDKAHLEAYQRRMKQLYSLDKFAFVDTEGLIYTSMGTQNNIEEYDFDYTALSEPKISIFHLENSDQRQVIIAVPTNVPFGDKTLSVCFMAIDMAEMLSGLSMDYQRSDATFSNIYTSVGVALTNQVLGGQAAETNLLEALKGVTFDEGYSYEQVAADFASGKRRQVSFTYQGIQETLSYAPIQGTDWFLTYLIRESVISEQIGSVSNRIITRSVIQSMLTAAVLMAMFLYLLRQSRKTTQLMLEKETAEAEHRVKQEEMEQRIALQNELLAQKEQGQQQSRMLKALSSDYRSVYYLELDKNVGICYQSRTDMHGFRVGEQFSYLESVTAYCHQYVTEPFQKEFLQFVQPDAVRAGLKNNLVISYRYMINVDGRESWEIVKFAGVRHPDEREDHLVHTVGACFVDVDQETRSALEQRQALRDALDAAEQANRAKTAFLSNMSHEIRTPMNAIIGLDNIALNDPQTPEKTRDYLEKIGDSANHLLNLINDILDMSRIESGRMTLKNEEYSFSELLQTVNTMFSGQCLDKGLEYLCNIKGEVDDYYIGDKMKLRQVLINILGNAVKFTPKGGKVELTVERLIRFENKTTLCFTIADTGIGISKEFLPKLFDTFSQEDSSNASKYGSSGLGLAITKNIVEMMNGSISVESEKGEGTTFRVKVTLMNSSPHEAEADAIVHPSDMTVLIVDDDPVACEHAKLVLEKAGIAAELASSGAEAIEKVQLRHARREPYNLILVDWQMPEMDGVEATRRIREIIGHESAIIILTAYRWDDVLEEALRAGVDSFIPKPLFLATVIEEFKSALLKKNAAAKQTVRKAELTGRRVLLAEDVPVNAEIMLMVLQMRSIEAELAENGRIAVEKFQAHEPGYFDAILMDMRMPEMDGLEATRTIRAMDRADAKTIPIIALTANAFDEDVQRSLQAGLNAHLSKPVQPDALFETLEGLIRP